MQELKRQNEEKNTQKHTFRQKGLKNVKSDLLDAKMLPKV